MGAYKGVREETPVDPEEELDMCEESFDIPEMNTNDDQIDALALFGDVDFEDKSAVRKRKNEWKKLFNGS